MARVFEAMQKFGRSTDKTNDYVSSFLQFYNFENAIDEPQALTEAVPGEAFSQNGKAEHQVTYAAASDLDNGQVLEPEFAVPVTEPAADDPVWSETEPLGQLWEGAEAHLNGEPRQPAFELLSEVSFIPAVPEPVCEQESSLIIETEAETVLEEDVLSVEAAVAQPQLVAPEAADEQILDIEVNESVSPVATPPVSPALVHAASQSLVVSTLPENVRDEFRRLRSSLLLAAESQQLQVILVCGVEAGDGGSFVARNLSLLLAEFDKINVARFDLDGSSTEAPGQTTLEPDSYQLALRRTALPNLREIATTQGAVTLSELLRVCDTRTMVAMLKSRFDFVLIDAPAVTTNPDTALLASQVDGVILVAQQDETRCHALAAARAALQNARANVLGVVLNRRRK
jgi:Mrp family chromosome partitioning ATPase